MTGTACRVTQIYTSDVWGVPAFAVFEPVKRDGSRNRNWRGWSGVLDRYTRVERRV